MKVTVDFDGVTTKKWFHGSRVVKLKTRTMTERELLAEAGRLRSDATPQALAHDGALVLARQIIALAASPAVRANGKGLGQADKRIAAAYRRMRAKNEHLEKKGLPLRAITSAALCVEAKTNQATAARWLAANVEGTNS